MKKLKILVVDDKKEHLEEAIEKLNEHDVTTASSYDVAEGYLAGSLSFIYPCSRWDNVGRDENGGFIKQEFDAVLTDLFLPASTRGVFPEILKLEEEIPYGLVLAMLAMRLDIPVAIVSRDGHHSHPILWAMDTLSTQECGFGDRKIKFAFGGDFWYPKQGKRWDYALKILMSQ